jgi:hypothetical protein
MNYFISATITILFSMTMLAGCDRTEAEQLAMQHSEEQSRINMATFKRNTQLREMKEQAEENGKDDE